MSVREIPWQTIKDRVLAKEPRAAPILDVIEKYWGDGKLTKELAERFIRACLIGDYVEAKRLLYQQADADALVEADRAANLQLRQWIEQEKKVYDFLGELQAATIQIALGCAMAMVGL